jgi:AcrR family transcriptional regulator
MMKLMTEIVKRSITPGPRDERGVLAARIVAASRDEFAEHGWAGTTIRAVARAADAATNPPQKWLDNVAKVWTTPIEQLGTAILKLMLASWADDEIGPTLHAILQTAAHEPATHEKLRRVVEGSLMGVSQLGRDEDERLVRSGLVASQTIGFALMRYVWKIEPIASMTDDEAIAAIAPNLQRYVSGDLKAI